ncbi:hypothetical protein C5D04_02095 [Rathayibacter sp. AY1D2]|uniref:hypothetical protein n=1 Tax=unclassified Rathayibacter TaxID=2609250 RepID=UPI000CE784E4|nr:MULTISPECIES: hypothetical protein [unclassified Rathayibacter]PPF59183.1 hypothetical protein C5C55_02715 [Rathayibacter sp. AY1C2]PPG18441.1 hypothetical protein C5D36_00130 [Rathayibacter sp. AY1C6]PPG63816.1 hypothetical protein C5C69_00830 [Rathayibacter sp. AY1C7]PPH53522.1 hypothetical protein C5C67_08400 [Rathayibacter sp. AY1E1]PPI18197.1 hypothetical protein C5D04_02095 [Rathayibacter sp. AY1D2]
MTAGPTGSPRTRRALLELAALAVVVSGTLLVLGFMVGTPWRPLLFRDGDSLALPLILQSFAEGRPAAWVMTSQLFLFPELPVFGVAWLLTGGDPAAALAVNAVLNVVLLYGVLRILARRLVADRHRRLRPAAALAGIAVLLVLCLTEGRALNNEGALATTFLLTTYYYGAVLTGLAGLAVALGALRERRPAARPLLLVGAAVAATTLSDPLLLVQFVGPLLVVLVVLLVLALAAPRAVLIVAGTVLGAAALGAALRVPLGFLIGTDAGGYLRLPLAGTALDDLIVQFLVLKAPLIGKLEVALLGLLLLAALAVVVAGAARLARGAALDEAARARFAVCAFLPAQTAVLLVVQVFTGSSVSRYLMPIPVTATVVVIALIGAAAAHRRAAGARLAPVVRVVAPLAAAGLVVAAVPATTAVASAAAEARSDPDADCLERWIDGRELAGVGSFWSTRPLDLYGPASLHVQQVNFDFTVQLWMNNLSDYRDRQYSFVLADRSPDWAGLARGTLGAPSDIVACGGFDIYDYAGTDGETELNRIVQTSVEEQRRERGY